MKKFGILILLSTLPAILMLTSFSGCEERKQKSVIVDEQYVVVKPADSLIEVYIVHTRYTDPGDFAYLYDDLPESIEGICDLIKKQLIHPMEASEIKHLLPDGRAPEDGDYPTVELMLKELIKRDSTGLHKSRKPSDRLIVACYHHGLLLASILRHRNIPVRLRGGFARYYEKKAKVRFGHVICELWDQEKQKWILVDPDRNIIDVSRPKFESPAHAWKEFNDSHYHSIRYICSVGEGYPALIHALLLDHCFVIKIEGSYWHTPEFVYKDNFDFRDLRDEQLGVITQIADMMMVPDTNINELIRVYDSNDFIQKKKRSIEQYYERK